MEDSLKTFVEHLEELRLRLIKAVAAVAAGTVLSYQAVDWILGVMAKPVGNFIFLDPTAALFVRLKVALMGGVLLALPIVLYQLWKFVAVGLAPDERRPMVWLLPASYLLFIAGFSFGFFVLVPAGVRFLLSYGSNVLVPTLAIENYVNFVGVICLTLGAVFEMPMVSFFAAKIGVFHAAQLAAQRRIAVLVSYVAGAILTPGPDPVTALLLAVPIYFLYEASILTARWARKNEVSIVETERI